MSENIAIISGASRGLGQACAQLLNKNGFTVIGLARSLIKEPYIAASYCVDISDLSKLEEVYGKILENLKSKSINKLVLINNAATLNPVGPLGNESLKDLDFAMRLNVTAPMWIMSATINKLQAQDTRIVNISSGAANNPYPGWASYCTTKAALRMASKNFAADLQGFDKFQKRKIAILEYEPGVIDTAMQEQVRNSGKENFPNIERFVELKKNDELISAAESASQILPFIEDQNAEPYQERRYKA